MQNLPLTSLLAVHAHPDDETLSTGGLLAATAAAGLPVTLVTLTRGEQGEVIGPLKGELEGHGVALARHREGELAGALAALGVRDHLFLDQEDAAQSRFEDSGMAWLDPELGAGRSATASLGDDVAPGALVRVPMDRAAELLAHVICARRPHTVVTYEPQGGYGHPDHVRTHEITAAALELAGRGMHGLPGHRPAQFLWSVIPADLVRAGRARLAEVGNSLADSSAGATYPGPDAPLASVSTWGEGDPLALDVRPVMGRVAAALRAHATQVQWTELLGEPLELGDAGVALAGSYALSNDILAPLLSHEFYVPAR